MRTRIFAALMALAFAVLPFGAHAAVVKVPVTVKNLAILTCVNKTLAEKRWTLTSPELNSLSGKERFLLCGDPKRSFTLENAAAPDVWHAVSFLLAGDVMRSRIMRSAPAGTSTTATNVASPQSDANATKLAAAEKRIKELADEKSAATTESERRGLWNMILVGSITVLLLLIAIMTVRMRRLSRACDEHEQELKDVPKQYAEDLGKLRKNFEKQITDANALNARLENINQGFETHFRLCQDDSRRIHDLEAKLAAESGAHLTTQAELQEARDALADYQIPQVDPMTKEYETGLRGFRALCRELLECAMQLPLIFEIDPEFVEQEVPRHKRLIPIYRMGISFEGDRFVQQCATPFYEKPLKEPLDPASIQKQTLGMAGERYLKERGIKLRQPPKGRTLFILQPTNEPLFERAKRVLAIASTIDATFTAATA